MYTIGISCIGGGVGQSIINACNLSGLPVRTVGLDTNPFAYGAYDCDIFDYVPSVYSDHYIANLIDRCKKYDVDLILPGLDDEILMYAQSIDKFEEAGINPVIAGEELIKLCRDKEKMSLELNRISNVFVASYDKKTLINDIREGKAAFPLIAKPRGGSASKGIRIIRDEQDLQKMSDGHIIQELAIPAKSDPNYDYYLRQIARNKNPQVSEISIQIVTGKEGVLLGKMMSYNKLKNGIPIEIIPIEDKRIWKVVDKLMPHFLKLGLRGPLNIQGRLTEKGFKIFEMNPRFTGITGLRALMGFNEVEACIANWLDIKRKPLHLTSNHNRFGVRQTADKAITIGRNKQAGNLSLKISSKAKNTSKTLLVTGAGGYLGRNFVHAIPDKGAYNIWVYEHDKEKLINLFPPQKVHLYDRGDFKSGSLSMGHIDVLLHFGFAGPHAGKEEIAGNLAFTSELFTKAAMHHVPAIINISSQSVYDLKQDSLWDETARVVPQTYYAQAMYATELMLESMKKINNQVKTTSLRLAALSGGDIELVTVDLVAKLVQEALRGENIKIAGRPQTIEKLDLRDAIDAVQSILKISPERWKPVYNVGSGAIYNISEVAEKAVEYANKYNSGGKPEIIIDKNDIKTRFGMDSSLFREDTGWKPSYRMNDTIDSLCRYFQTKGKVS